MQNNNFWLQMLKFGKNIITMFSTGQLIFAVLFFIAFVIVMIFSYRKDIQVHQKFYKGNYKVLIAINGDFLINRYNEFLNIDNCYIDLIRLDGKVLVSNDFTSSPKINHPLSKTNFIFS